MKIPILIASLFLFAATVFASGTSVQYEIDGAQYEGYYISPAPDAPLVLLIHDWDGLTDYEIKRATMLAGMGYAVFAADLFGKGIRPTEMKDKRQHTGELYKDRKKMRALLAGALTTAKAQGGNVDNAVTIFVSRRGNGLWRRGALIRATLARRQSKRFVGVGVRNSELRTRSVVVAFRQVLFGEITMRLGHGELDRSAPLRPIRAGSRDHIFDSGRLHAQLGANATGAS